MNWLNNLFNKNQPKNHKITCPRCLGKGHVDEADIRRLGQVLRWLPGACAYCNGQGKVRQELTQSVAANDAFLTVNLTEEQRERFLLGDVYMRHWAQLNEAASKDLLKFIVEEHEQHFRSTGEIVDALLDRYPDMPSHSKLPEQQFRIELRDYVERVIEELAR